MRRSLLDRGHTGIPGRDSAEFDVVLSTIITQEMLQRISHPTSSPVLTVHPLVPAPDLTVVAACPEVAVQTAVGRSSLLTVMCISVRRSERKATTHTR
jgi:hypothetical protein